MKSCEGVGCNVTPCIKIHGKYFCMKHYEIYAQKLSEALPPFEFVTQEEIESTSVKKEKPKERFDWSLLIGDSE